MLDVKQDCERRIARQPEQKRQQQQLVVCTCLGEPSPRGDVARLGHDPRASAAADGPHRRRAADLDNARQRDEVTDGCDSTDERGGGQLDKRMCRRWRWAEHDSTPYYIAGALNGTGVMDTTQVKWWAEVLG